MLQTCLIIIGFLVCGSVGFLIGAIFSCGTISDLQAQNDILKSHNATLEELLDAKEHSPFQRMI
jgi:hypothetical protein